MLWGSVKSHLPILEYDAKFCRYGELFSPALYRLACKLKANHLSCLSLSNKSLAQDSSFTPSSGPCQLPKEVNSLPRPTHQMPLYYALLLQEVDKQCTTVLSPTSSSLVKGP
jgi:hypothetical protein